ncbi:HAD family acid phosphatase [Sphingomonas crusticola]|uniref:HAD family acid phosphatase n=1 Tax=Sphingomonas crusticola TaxID=1697973 RepID=UPI000E273686|nr:HAD family acid phosphatase [Sphingomonas crusticola]
MRHALTAMAVALALSAPAASLTKKQASSRAHRVAAAKPYYPPQPPPVPANLHGIQYLYGSAEAAALTRQTWRALADYVDAQLARGERSGVILAPGSTLANPHFVPCDGRPPAIVLDVDETAILNLGAEYDDLVAQRKAFDQEAWDRWEKGGANYVAPTPGAKEALDRLRGHGVTVIFNSNRAAANAAGAEGALNVAGLGPAKHGETLFLNGDDASGSGKDGRRATIAARYCVLAMAGDQLVDFSDLFTTEPNSIAARRASVAYSGLATLWGAGWFVLPNPVYGKALQGEADDIFPKDKQWRDPGSVPPATPPAPIPRKAKH